MTFGCDPAGVVKRQSAGGDKTVQMWMELEVLTPGVENGKYADARAEVAAVGRDPQQGLGSGARQHGIKEPLVAQC